MLRRVGEMPLVSLNSYVVDIEHAHRRSLQWPLWGNLSDGCGSKTAIGRIPLRLAEVGRLQSSGRSSSRRPGMDNHYYRLE